MRSIDHPRRALGAVHAALLAVAVAFLALPAVSGAATSASAAGSSRASVGLGNVKRGQSAHVVGWALLGPRERVRGGVVRAWSMDGRSILLGRADRSSRTGTFDVRVRRLPRRFVISVSGGRVNGWKVRGTLGVVVDGRRVGRIVHVTPITTVIAARVGIHRSVSRAEREVRRLLQLPAWYDLYADVRVDGRQFDGGRFVRAAQRRGGLQRYVDRVADRVGGARLAFRGRPAARPSALGGGPESLIELIARGAAGGAGSLAFGRIVALIGIGGGDDVAALRGELEAIKRQLQEISVQLVAVRADIAKLENQLAKSTYQTLYNGLGLTQVGTENDRISEALTWLVDETAACAGGDASRCSAGIPTANARGWCLTTTSAFTARQAVVCELISLLDSTLDTGRYDLFHSRLVGDGALGVVDAFQELLYTQAKTGTGFVTSDYRPTVQRVIDRFSWITALLASYYAEHVAIKQLPPERVTAKVRQVRTQLAELAGLAPRPLPPRSVVQAATNKLWHVVENPRQSCGTTPTRHRFLWWRDGDGRVPDQPGCLAERRAAIAAIDDSQAWLVPDEATARRFVDAIPVDNREAATVEEALAKKLKLPDLSGLASAYPAPPPNATDTLLNRRLIWLTGSYFGNPGTSAGIETSDCAGVEWNLGTEIKLWDLGMTLRINGLFCRYVRFDDRSAPLACVRAFQWPVIRYDMGMPCEAPASTYRYKGHPLNGPVDYGHPLALMVQRPVTPEDRFFRTP